MKRWTLRLAALLVPMLSVAAAACPMCKDSIPNSDAQTATMVPGAVNNSIFFMFVGFLSMLGMITWTLVKGANSSHPYRGGTGFPLDDLDKKK